jgi:hypothetical protein
MNITMIGATDPFASGFADWALEQGHVLTVVGFTDDRGQRFAGDRRGSSIGVGPAEPLRDDVIVLALPYVCVRPVLDHFAGQIDGKIVIDLVNAVDLQTLKPVRPKAGSVAQEIAEARPRAKVVKAFSPRFASPSAVAQGQEQTRDVSVAADDEQAKGLVIRLFDEGGLHPIDAGSLDDVSELERRGYIAFTGQQPPADSFGSGEKAEATA